MLRILLVYQNIMPLFIFSFITIIMSTTGPTISITMM
uniref:Uncharacterized protein n=1 Tax=Rhizophora mucronata TaxID=61149 RepID=A0A2P2NV83_RHIMU